MSDDYLPIVESPSPFSPPFFRSPLSEEPSTFKLNDKFTRFLRSDPNRCSTFSQDSQSTAADDSWGDSEEDRIWISASSDPRNTSEPRHRTLVLCFDGTGDQFDGDNSNVVQFLAMLKKHNNSQQLVYYQAGIGTYTDPIFSMPISNTLSLAFDQMLAWNLPSHVKDGYAFLMQNYTHGDKICIFGFSRGAYTARALAGMLQKVGLLPVCNHQQLPFAFEMYAREDEESLKLSHMFKKTFSRTVQVDFLGIWDTVASVGIIPHFLPFVHENTGIRHLRHALALDERRVKFLPQYCVAPTPQKWKKHKHRVFKRKKPHHAPSLSKAYEDLINSNSSNGEPDVKEVWFAGVHTDVGGGSVPNGTRYSLARIPLRWMIRECFKCDTGIIFDGAQLQQAGLRIVMKKGRPTLANLPPRIMVHVPPYSGRPRPRSSLGWMSRVVLNAVETVLYIILVLKTLFWRRRTHPGALPFIELDSPNQLQEQTDDYEVREELEDAISPLYDQLQARASWHLLEWIPQPIKTPKAIIEKAEDGNRYAWAWNRGRGRKIPSHEMRAGVKIHRSVKTRLEATHRLGRAYIPQVRPEIRNYVNGKKVKEARQLTHEEWNVDNPKYWEWVD